MANLAHPAILEYIYIDAFHSNKTQKSWTKIKSQVSHLLKTAPIW